MLKDFMAKLWAKNEDALTEEIIERISHETNITAADKVAAKVSEELAEALITEITPLVKQRLLENKQEIADKIADGLLATLNSGIDRTVVTAKASITNAYNRKSIIDTLLDS